MSTYKKHTWSSGVPNRKKFDEMDSEIEKLSSEGLPPISSGDSKKPLVVGTSGAMWGHASAEYVSYFDDETYGTNTVGKAINSLSEKIVNLYHDYSTTEYNTGRKWLDESDIWVNTIYLQNISIGTNEYNFSDYNISPNKHIKSEIIVHTDAGITFTMNGTANRESGGNTSGISYYCKENKFRLSVGEDFYNGGYGTIDYAYITMYYTKS